MAVKQLLTEFYELCKDGICQDLLTEREKREVENGALYLSGRLQTCEKKNGNGKTKNGMKNGAKKNGNGMNGLTAAQKKLPKALQAAILKKKKKK